MSQNKNYMIQLDGLRFFAVSGVAWFHWAPKDLQFVIPWNIGVQLFFVISGFLITGILLKSKKAVENSVALNLVTMGIWTVAIASASWYFFEKPINNLKKRFPYF